MQKRYPELLNPLIREVRAAGALLLDGPAQTVHEKGRSDFVTELDLAVSRRLIRNLPKLLSGSVVLSEEDTAPDTTGRPAWIVDPVDGTTNLIYGAQQSAVSVALVTEGRAVLAVVLNPFQDDLYTAVAGAGARHNGHSVSVRPDATLRDSLIGFGTTPYEKQLLLNDMDLLADVFREAVDLRRSGSAALDLCYVAAGRLTGFFERVLQPWDYAAGQLILEEAGGRLTTFDGRAPSLPEPSSILATNGFIHDEMLRLFAPYADRSPR